MANPNGGTKSQATGWHYGPETKVRLRKETGVWVTWGPDSDPGHMKRRSCGEIRAKKGMGGLLLPTALERGNTGVGQEHVICVAFL